MGLSTDDSPGPDGEMGMQSLCPDVHNQKNKTKLACAHVTGQKPRNQDRTDPLLDSDLNS